MALTLIDLRGDVPRRLTRLGDDVEAPPPWSADPEEASPVHELLPPPEGTPAQPPEAAPHRTGFRIHRGEPLMETLRRVAVDQFDSAIAGLDSSEGDEGIHHTRTSLKRIRALLRLASGVIGNKKRRTESRLLAATARRVSGAREAAVLVATIERIRTHYGRLLVPEAFAAVSARVAARHRREIDDVSDQRAEVAEILADCRQRYVVWPSPLRVGFQGIAVGLADTYGLGRRLMSQARRQGTDPAFHEWRKRVKDLRYQFELLEPVWPQVVGGAAEMFESLGDVLGEHHDLAVLEAEIARRGDLCPDPEERTLLESIAAHRQRRLEAEAFGMAAKAFAESPPRLVDRLGRYWKAWR